MQESKISVQLQNILKEREKAENINALIVPGSQQVVTQIYDEGIG